MNLSTRISTTDGGGGTWRWAVVLSTGVPLTYVMMGGMLAGHDQSGGEVKVKENGTKVKLFYGMSSATAMEKHSGGVAEYRSVLH